QGSVRARREGAGPGGRHGGGAAAGKARRAADRGRKEIALTGSVRPRVDAADERGSMARMSERSTRIADSPTMAVTATVDKLRRAGVEVIDFGAGEADFATPDPVKAAAHAAIDQNFTKYTPASGILELKRGICDRYRADYGVAYSDSEVLVTAGGKQAMFNP